jgi:protein gp37
MSENSKIEWCDHTFNPWQGCTKVSPGCDHCYAEARQDTRLHVVKWGAGKERKRTSAHNWRGPLAWNRKHAEFFAQHGRRQRVFCASLADVFDNEVPITWLADLLGLIWSTPQLDWLLLTKRIGNALPRIREAAKHKSAYGMAAEWIHGNPPANVWLGATIVNQEEADRDIPKLLAVPARVRFLSMEPLLGPVDLTDLVKKEGACEHHFSALDCDVDPADDEWSGATIDWVIVGGESGPNARPMHHQWGRDLRDQCAAAGVPFLWKQWGEWLPESQQERSPQFPNIVADGANGCPPHGWPEGRVHRWPDGTQSYRTGKKAAGRLLDGVTHDGYPEMAS